MKRDSVFTPFELRVILEDQDTALRSFHLFGIYKDCVDLSRCPKDHFMDLTQSEIKLRQEITHKLEAK